MLKVYDLQLIREINPRAYIPMPNLTLKAILIQTIQGREAVLPVAQT